VGIPVYDAILLTGKVSAVEQDCKTLQTDDADDADTVQRQVSNAQLIRCLLDNSQST